MIFFNEIRAARRCVSALLVEDIFWRFRCQVTKTSFRHLKIQNHFLKNFLKMVLTDPVFFGTLISENCLSLMCFFWIISGPHLPKPYLNGQPNSGDAQTFMLTSRGRKEIYQKKHNFCKLKVTGETETAQVFSLDV